MIDKPIKLGLDRFLAKEWVDYSLELYLSSPDDYQNYQLLKNYLNASIPGKESARKTANQLKRLWLTPTDVEDGLRKSARELLLHHQISDLSIFHLGMALNAFPIFRETCRRIGELSKLQKRINKQTIVDRVGENYVNPTSIPRIVARVLQTLIDWNLIEESRVEITIKPITISDHSSSAWFIQALFLMKSTPEIPLVDFDLLPEKMGVNFPDLRTQLRVAPNLSIRRSLTGEEIITVNE